jgi:hypothetical protein
MPVAGTDEDTIYNLTAFLKLVKLSIDDCDIHMEVADTTDPSAPRRSVSDDHQDRARDLQDRRRVHEGLSDIWRLAFKVAADSATARTQMVSAG